LETHSELYIKTIDQEVILLPWYRSVLCCH